MLRAVSKYFAAAMSKHIQPSSPIHMYVPMCTPSRSDLMHEHMCVRRIFRGFELPWMYTMRLESDSALVIVLRVPSYDRSLVCMELRTATQTVALQLPTIYAHIYIP